MVKERKKSTNNDPHKNLRL